MSTQLAVSAAAEWRALVSTAVLGADRHPLPAAAQGWDRWPGDTDPAVALLDRAAAVAVARRAGAVAGPRPQWLLPEAPPDPRPPCTAACAQRLGRILAGQHEIVLAEWLHRCGEAGMQLPAAHVPALLLRGRRRPDLDQVVRHLAGARAAWLAQAVPELGVKPTPAMPTTPVAPLRPVPPPPDGASSVSLVVAQLRDGRATWAALPHLTTLVAGYTPDALAAFVSLAGQQGPQVTTARTHAALTELAEFRLGMLREFAEATSPGAQASQPPPSSPPSQPDPTGDPS